MNKQPSTPKELALATRRILKIISRKKYSYRHIQIILATELLMKPSLSFIWKVVNIRNAAKPKYKKR